MSAASTSALRRQQPELPSGGRRAVAARAPLLLLVALSRAAGAAAGSPSFLEVRSPQQRHASTGVTELLAMHEASGAPALAEFPGTPKHPSGPTHPTKFGPANCVSLSKSSIGTCVIQVACGKTDISKVDFSFVCLTGGQQTKQHSYGKGGFDADEVFDSGVPCESCTTVPYATLTGGKLVHNEILTGGAAGADSGEKQPEHETAKTNDTETGEHPPKVEEKPKKRKKGEKHYKGVVEERVPNGTMRLEGVGIPALFGPSACVSTYLSPKGTCIIQTRCRGVDLSNFAVGVTCLDKTGDYTRYLFGKSSFDDEETFDTLLSCKACVGVGDQPSYQLSGLLPKAIVQGLASLRTEVSSLREEVADLKTIHRKKEKQEKMAREKEAKEKEKEEKEEEAETEKRHSSSANSTGTDSDEDEATKSDGNSTSASSGDNSSKSDASHSASSDNSTSGGDAGAETGTGDAGGHEALLEGENAAVHAGDAPEHGKLTVRDLLRRLVAQEH